MLSIGLRSGPEGWTTDRGIRELYNPSYYVAFVIAPGGHNIEAVFHENRA